MQVWNAIGFASVAQEMAYDVKVLLGKMEPGETVDDVVNQKIRNIDDNLFELINWLKAIQMEGGK